MTGRLRSERGQAGIALIIVIAWALAAVFMLTRTLVAAQQINTRVKTIRSEVTGIKGDTALVAELTKTNEIASAILVAAKPLAPMLETVDATAKSINSTVTGILGNATSIGSTVNLINGNVKSILSVATEINNGVAAINGRADRALSVVNLIKGDTGSIQRAVASGSGQGIHWHACNVDSVKDGHC